MVILISYGSGLTDLQEGQGLNRIEFYGDSLVAFVGPDSIDPRKHGLYIDGVIFPFAFAIARTDLPVVFNTLLSDHDIFLPRTVDWRAVADTASRDWYRYPPIGAR
jgi:hypothetical protein